MSTINYRSILTFRPRKWDRPHRALGAFAQGAFFSPFDGSPKLLDIMVIPFMRVGRNTSFSFSCIFQMSCDTNRL